MWLLLALVDLTEWYWWLIVAWVLLCGYDPDGLVQSSIILILILGTVRYCTKSSRKVDDSANYQQSVESDDDGFGIFLQT